MAARKDRIASVYEKQLRKKTDALDSIKNEINKRRKKIGALEKAEGNYLARLEYLETNIAASKKYLVMLSKRIDTAETTIVRLTDSLTQARALLAGRQSVMKQRLRRAYMTGTLSPLMSLLMSRNPLDMVNRARYLEEVYAYDQNLALKIDRARKAIDEKKRSFETKRSELGLLLREKKKENVLLLKEETSRRAIIADIRSKKKSNMTMIAELESAQKELNAIIRLLEDKRRKAVEQSRAVAGARSVFERLKGTLPWPLDGPVISRFGKIVHPVYHTVTMNNGIDIGAAPGQQVRCVASGTVIYTGSMRGLGRLVIVEHGGDYLTIYSHLDEIGVSDNQKVVAGTVLGRVGPAAETEGTILHFEIRKSTNSLNPTHWLRG
ncbi:MAG: peptidoglycan DD-metalloendopeptidase family protein [Chitinispirillaceae bacterium]|nr:peptidoglycan DD-metalloendopeptidase family protein [Chitinispirillaceae bacterium]